jgi:hypothetical protein
VGERLRIAFLACYGMAAAFLLAATFASGSAATICGILSGLFVTVGFFCVVGWFLSRSGR